MDFVLLTALGASGSATGIDLVLLTALGVGGATVIGSVIGFIFKNLSHKFSDIVLSFAAGVMLAAAVLGLILPSLDYGGDWGLLITILGIFAGAVCLNFVDKLVPHLHRLMEPDTEKHNNSNLNKILFTVVCNSLRIRIPYLTIQCSCLILKDQVVIRFSISCLCRTFSFAQIHCSDYFSRTGKNMFFLYPNSIF